jgi:hypothetical protein
MDKGGKAGKKWRQRRGEKREDFPLQQGKTVLDYDIVGRLGICRADLTSRGLVSGYFRFCGASPA